MWLLFVPTYTVVPEAAMVVALPSPAGSAVINCQLPVVRGAVLYCGCVVVLAVTAYNVPLVSIAKLNMLTSVDGWLGRAAQLAPESVEE